MGCSLISTRVTVVQIHLPENTCIVCGRHTVKVCSALTEFMRLLNSRPNNPNWSQSRYSCLPDTRGLPAVLSACRRQMEFGSSLCCCPGDEIKGSQGRRREGGGGWMTAVALTSHTPGSQPAAPWFKPSAGGRCISTVVLCLCRVNRHYCGSNAGFCWNAPAGRDETFAERHKIRRHYFKAAV